MASPQNTSDPSTDRTTERELFYERAKKHIDSVNPRFREKAVIERILSEISLAFFSGLYQS